MSASLLHKKSQLVTFDQLRALPVPEALSAMHKPVPHDVLIECLRVEASKRGFDVVREQFAINAKGSKVFGVMDLVLHTAASIDIAVDSQLSLGFRNSTNRALAIRAVAGRRVMVCDNLTLMGDTIAISRKNTIGLDLATALIAGFDRFMQHATMLDKQIMRLQAKQIIDAEAKAIIFDAINAQVVPIHLFGDVAAAYFHPTDEMTDCTPRTLYGLYNAFTRAVKQLNPMAGWQATIALGRQFNVRADDAIDV